MFVAPAVGFPYAYLHEGEKYGPAPQPEGAARVGGRDRDHGATTCRSSTARGVRIVPGGDYGLVCTPMGRNARDLELFVTLFGFSPAESLVAATNHGGAMMGLGDELGQLRAGWLADLIVVDGDPLDDIAVLQDREQDQPRDEGRSDLSQRSHRQPVARDEHVDVRPLRSHRPGDRRQPRHRVRAGPSARAKPARRSS